MCRYLQIISLFSFSMVSNKLFAFGWILNDFTLDLTHCIQIIVALFRVREKKKTTVLEIHEQKKCNYSWVFGPNSKMHTEWKFYENYCGNNSFYDIPTVFKFNFPLHINCVNMCVKQCYIEWLQAFFSYFLGFIYLLLLLIHNYRTIVEPIRCYSQINTQSLDYSY